MDPTEPDPTSPPDQPVSVVVDSAAALPSDLIDRLGLGVVPLRLTLRGASVPDGSLPLEDVIAHLGDGIKTSAPSPGDWASAFEAALRPGGAVVALTVSAQMSATYSAAGLAAEEFGGRVRVVDTGTAAGAEGLVALAAARSAAAGSGLDAVACRAVEVSEKVRLRATLDSLDHLVQSGRVPSIAGWAGRMMNVHPLFEFAKHAVRRSRPALSREAAIHRMLQTVAKSAPSTDAILHAAALHAADPATAAELQRELETMADDVDVFVAPFSPVMIAHTGPGLAGVAWWWDDRDREAS
jgi:DegV family protein with EDD domain